MTQGGLVAESVEIAVEPDAGSSRDGGGASIVVGGTRVVLRVDASSAGFSACRVQLLWLTPAERDVLESGGAIDASRGLGAVLAPLLTMLAGGAGAGGAGAGGAGAGGAGGRQGDRERLAIMARGLLSAIAAERVDSEDHDVAPQQRLAVLAMQLIHSQLEDPQLSSAAIARQLSVSLRTLQAAFRQASGSVADSIRLLRLERARIEIDTVPDESPIDVSALGAQWGFRGRDHFARAFERHYGMRPESARDLSQSALRA